MAPHTPAHTHSQKEASEAYEMKKRQTEGDKKRNDIVIGNRCRA